MERIAPSTEFNHRMSLVVLSSIIIVAIATIITITYYSKRKTKFRFGVTQTFIIDMTKKCKERKGRGKNELRLRYSSGESCVSSCDEQDNFRSAKNKGYFFTLLMRVRNSFFENISSSSTNMSEYGAFYWHPGQIPHLLKEYEDDIPKFKIPTSQGFSKNSNNMIDI